MSNSVFVEGGDLDQVATIGTILSGGGLATITVATVLSPVVITGTVTAIVSGATIEIGTIITPEQIGTVGTLLAGNVTATVSDGQLADVGTVGTVQAQANLAQASLVGSLAAGNVTATVSGGQLSDVGTVGTILSGAISASITGGNIPVVGTVGTLQAQANIAVASLVGSLGSPVGVAGGTIGTLQAGNVTATISGGQVGVGTILSDQQGSTATLFAATLFYGVNTSLLPANTTRKEFTVTQLQPGTVAVAYSATVGSLNGIRLQAEGQTLSDAIYTGVVTGMALAGSVIVSVNEVRP